MVVRRTFFLFLTLDGLGLEQINGLGVTNKREEMILGEEWREEQPEVFLRGQGEEAVSFEREEEKMSLSLFLRM